MARKMKAACNELESEKIPAFLSFEYWSSIPSFMDTSRNILRLRADPPALLQTLWKSSRVLEWLPLNLHAEFGLWHVARR